MKLIRQLRYRLEQGWSFIEALSITNWVSGFQAGKDAQQERIIKLLESKPSPCSDYCIALIKGEQK